MRIGLLAALFCGVASMLSAEQVDMTNLICKRSTTMGVQTWEFYGSAMIRYYETGSPTRFERIGTGTYEKYDREGEWNAAYMFFRRGDVLYARVLARPGLLAREEDKHAPMEIGIFPFNAECKPLWESN